MQDDSGSPENITNGMGYKKTQRPKNLNLLSVKFPISAVMSIGHRAAGILLFLSLPYFLHLLQMSLASETGFALAKVEMQGPLIKIFGLIVIWALAHHFFAGIRFFLLDLDIGIKKNVAQKTAMLVIFIGFIVFALFSLFLL